MVVDADTSSRMYLCPRCVWPGVAPMHGGEVACSRCGATSLLPARARVLDQTIATLPPPDGPARLAHLRAQAGRVREVPSTLRSVLGGNEIQPGREQEALLIWQSLRLRAQSGDVAASEDMSALTLMLAELPSMTTQPALVQALSESTFDAAVLPRHRQEQLGRLCRTAISNGDRSRAEAMLALMSPAASELDSDSEYRVSASAMAALDRDGQRILTHLGPQIGVLPITDSLSPLASVLRAHAYELVGDRALAAKTLRELPDPRMLEIVRASFPSLGLCAAAVEAYARETTLEAAARTAASTVDAGGNFGRGLIVTGVAAIVVGLVVEFFEGRIEASGAMNFVMGVTFLCVGVISSRRARSRGKHAAWLRVSGTRHAARVVDAVRTGREIHDVPVYRLNLHVSGPQGAYAASVEKLLPEHQVATILGKEVRVRANPVDPSEVILEE